MFSKSNRKLLRILLIDHPCEFRRCSSLLLKTVVLHTFTFILRYITSYSWQDYIPELSDISHKKCADVPTGSSVTLRKISTAKYHEEFGSSGAAMATPVNQ